MPPRSTGSDPTALRPFDVRDEYDYDPPIGTLPRLDRGVVWSDIVAEINAELEARKAA